MRKAPKRSQDLDAKSRGLPKAAALQAKRAPVPTADDPRNMDRIKADLSTSGDVGNANLGFDKASKQVTPTDRSDVVDPRRNIEVVVGDRPMSRVKADLSTDGVLGNAALVGQFTADRFPDYDLTQTTFSLQALIKKSKQGDIGLADSLLVAQASSLNSVYLECMRRAAVNMQQGYLEASETYARLGLKAQAQCRLTLETLSKIKNPPNVAFVKQANIANGPQQINNGEAVGKATRTQEFQEPPIELLEAQNGEWMDTRAQEATIDGDSPMATVGAIYGPADCRGTATRQPECMERGREADATRIGAVA